MKVFSEDMDIVYYSSLKWIHENKEFASSFVSSLAVVPHAPYSLDLHLCDFLFPKMKLKLKGKKCIDILEIQQNVQ
jgi:hypothetical protein